MYRSPSPSPYYHGPDAHQFPRSHSPQPGPRSHSPAPPIQRAYSPAPPPVQRAYSPQPPAQQNAAAAIQPGSITYTSTTGPDGRPMYQQFKAVPASYQTPQGIISGIQWVPVEATSVLPAGAVPAGPDFQASWGRGQLGNQDNRNITEWETERRRKEEEQAAKAARESRYGYDPDIAAARERDAIARERRKSISQGYTPAGYTSSNYSAGGGYPDRTGSAASGYTGYPSSGGHNRDSSYDLDRHMNDLALRDRDRDYDGPGTRERKVSLGRSRQYSTSENTGGNRSRAVSGNLGARPDGYGAGAAGPYGSVSGPYNASTRSTSGPTGPIPHASPNMRAASPNMRPGELPYNPAGATSGLSYPGANYSSSPSRPPGDTLPRSTTPFGSPTAVYPRGHVMEGQPIPHSRAASPNPSGIPSNPSAGGPAYPNPVSFPKVDVPQYGRPSSPNPMPAGSHYGRPASPNPMPVAGSHYGRVASPNPMPAPGHYGRVASPNPMGEPPVGGQQLQAPACFSRPVNAARSYAPFNVFKVQDMEKFWTTHPNIPRILEEHDMYPEDWERLMKDVSLAWAGRLPVPDFARTGKPPRPSALTADLVDLWNASFFAVRGVELVLYKGRERRSGAKAGLLDKDLPYLSEPDDYPSSEEDEPDDDSDPDIDARRSNYLYSPQMSPQNNIDDVFETGRRRREAKIREREERRARRHDRNKRRREKYKQSKYSLYLYYNPSQMAAGMGGGSPGMANMPTPGGYHTSGYGTRGGYPSGQY